MLTLHYNKQHYWQKIKFNAQYAMEEITVTLKDKIQEILLLLLLLLVVVVVVVVVVYFNFYFPYICI
jgi:hypothetical protein